MILYSSHAKKLMNILLFLKSSKNTQLAILLGYEFLKGCKLCLIQGICLHIRDLKG